MTDSIPTLESILEELANQYPLQNFAYFPQTIEEAGGVYSFTMALNFPGGVPVLPYEKDHLTVDVGGREAMVQLKPVAYAGDHWLDTELPHVVLGYAVEDEIICYQHRLETNLDEVTISAEQIQDYTEGEYGGDPVHHIAISANKKQPREMARLDGTAHNEPHKDKKQSGQNIRLTICMNSLEHYRRHEMDTQWRFDHVDNLRVNGKSYPVTIEACNLMDISDNEANGRVIHSSDSLTEEGDIRKMDFVEEVQNIPLDELLHREAPWPDEPTSW